MEGGEIIRLLTPYLMLNKTVLKPSAFSCAHSVGDLLERLEPAGGNLVLQYFHRQECDKMRLKYLIPDVPDILCVCTVLRYCQ